MVALRKGASEISWQKVAWIANILKAGNEEKGGRGDNTKVVGTKAEDERTR